MTWETEREDRRQEQWFVSAIVATYEAKFWRIVVWGYPRQKFLDLSVNQDRKQWQPHVIPATQEPEFKWIFTQLSHVKKSDPITNITRDKWLKYNSRVRAWLASGKPWVQIQVSQKKMDRRIEGSQVVDKKKR
jgi:hypothetical protein